jgi:general secretion pathway protein D
LVLAGALSSGRPATAQEPAPAEAAPEAEPPLGDEEAMVLNFERAEIREVIHSLASALGISYTIDPRIEGQVTIRTTGKISREDLFPLLNQILRNNGIAAVKVGDIYQILPVAEAKTRAIIPRRPDAVKRAREDDNFVIEIISLDHVSADEMANVLQPFVTPGGDVLSYARGNYVVVTDLESNVARLRELTRTFDVDAFSNLHTRVFKMQHGDPDELANEILGLLAPYGVTGGPEGDSVYILPLSRLNSMVVVALDPAIFTEVEKWLRLLDIPPEEGAGRQTFVYSVENAKAADLADVLNELFGGGQGGGGLGAPGRAPGAAPGGVGLFGAGGVSGGVGGRSGGRIGSRGGGGIGGGGAGAGGQAGMAFGQQAAGGIAGGAGGGALGGGRGGVGGRLGRGAGGVAGAPGAPGQPGQPGGGVRGVSLPGGPQAAPPGAPGQPQGPPPIFKQEVRIVADDVTNSLVILATKRDFQLIVDVLRKIDVMPRQVVLEVTIAEVGLNKALSFGIEYALAQGRLKTSVPDPNAVPDSSSIFRNGAPSVPVGGLISEAVQRVPGSGAFAVISDRQNFQIFLNALATVTSVKMLSAPHIIAADNREAHILVGQSIPILTSTQTSTVATAAIVNSVQYRDTGKILTILPQVNSKGLVNMQIRQEVSDVGVASFGNTNSPSFITREAETTVVVQDGETVLIGGIISDSISHLRSGVPFLMDIPVVGRAFRSDRDSLDRTELMLLITPYVIRSRDEARDVTHEFSERLGGLKGLGLLRRRYERRRPGEADQGNTSDTGAAAPGAVAPGGGSAPDVVPSEALP